jgi:hypothetical protein
MNGGQHIEDCTAVIPTPEKRNDQNEWQRHEPHGGKQNEPPEEADQALTNDS